MAETWVGVRLPHPMSMDVFFPLGMIFHISDSDAEESAFRHTTVFIYCNIFRLFVVVVVFLQANFGLWLPLETWAPSSHGFSSISVFLLFCLFQKDTCRWIQSHPNPGWPHLQIPNPHASARTLFLHQVSFASLKRKGGDTHI